MTQELEAPVSAQRDKLLTTELVPEQVLPKVMTTFGLTATYVFIICWITGSSIMAAGGWTAIPMWILGILTFLIPAGMAVAELGNLWPGEGGVYIWATRTMGETWGFIGGYLSWIPVVLNSASSPAIILQFLLLAFHAELGLTLSIILQVVLLWAVVGLALARLAANQRIMSGVFIVYGVLTAVIFVSGVIYAIRNGSAQEFTAHAALVPDFAGAGFLYGTVLLYLVGVETPYNMGAEFLSVRKSGPKMVVYGLDCADPHLPADHAGHHHGAAGRPGKPGHRGHRHARYRRTQGRDGSGAVVLAGIVFVALMSYQVTYSRLVFVSGLERHLPRVFTHLNPRTRNPVTAILIQGVLSSLIIVGLYSQSSMANVTVFLQGGSVHRVADLRLLLPGPGHHRAQEVRRSLCGREVLADPRRHGRRVDRVVIGSVGTIGGIYYSFAKSWIADVPDSTWMTWTGSIAMGMFALGVVVYIFGRRSAHKMTQEDALAHLAVLDLKKSETPSPEAV